MKEKKLKKKEKRNTVIVRCYCCCCTLSLPRLCDCIRGETNYHISQLLSCMDACFSTRINLLFVWHCFYSSRFGPAHCAHVSQSSSHSKPKRKHITELDRRSVVVYKFAFKPFHFVSCCFPLFFFPFFSHFFSPLALTVASISSCQWSGLCGTKQVSQFNLNVDRAGFPTY